MGCSRSRRSAVTVLRIGDNFFGGRPTGVFELRCGLAIDRAEWPNRPARHASDGLRAAEDSLRTARKRQQRFQQLCHQGRER